MKFPAFTRGNCQTVKKISVRNLKTAGICERKRIEVELKVFLARNQKRHIDTLVDVQLLVLDRDV